MKWRRVALPSALVVFLLAPLAAPQSLTFPYSQEIAGHQVWSEQPIGPQLKRIVGEADLRAAASPIAAERNQPIFLTLGGWRWRWLTLGAGPDGPFAISRPGFETIVVNRSDIATNRVFRAAAVGGVRPLSAVLAHEMTHAAIRQHFGLLAERRYPAWVREGYCDYVAGNASLTDAEANALIAKGQNHPALAYWRGRKRVEAELARNGGSVDALFASSGS